ncbi:hypothetical protein GOQ29_03420 [Clostridium sp. D2Q-14]|uniref:hypothetical protein n=1 Tax=Anaeromonas gelatinilytica TaxID=2683194 RepID=UPI00193BE3F0|nr:hypothetical protein [Anaeromonas gelatinilytica]MBS4534660.1 hypothetical protein [Anaeromonas gelatinilytica]
MKKILCFCLTLMLLMILTISLNHNNIITIKNIFIPINLTEDIIDDYFSNNTEKKSEAIKQIKEIVLNDLGFKNWTDYSDYMNILIFPEDINKNKITDVIIVLNLSKDSSIIAIYENNKTNYRLKYTIKDLPYIEHVSTININNNFFLVTEEIIDEKLGGYYYDKSITIYNHNNNDFKKVFQESKTYEAYFYEGWDNKDIENAKWFKLAENNLIDIIPKNDSLNINVDKNLKVYNSDESTTSIPSNFQDIKQKDFLIKYYWSEKFNYFIQKEGKTIDSGELVGIVSIYNQYVDSFLSNDELTYKIIDENGNLKHENLNNIEILE